MIYGQPDLRVKNKPFGEKCSAPRPFNKPSSIGSIYFQTSWADVCHSVLANGIVSIELIGDVGVVITRHASAGSNQGAPISQRRNCYLQIILWRGSIFSVGNLAKDLQDGQPRKRKWKKLQALRFQMISSMNRWTSLKPTGMMNMSSTATRVVDYTVACSHYRINHYWQWMHANNDNHNIYYSTVTTWPTIPFL